MGVKPKALSPRARAKRDQIRSAARTLFLLNGFAATSTDSLAAEAGVSKQTLYAYYPSKEELLADVLKEAIEEIVGEAPVAKQRPRPIRSPSDLERALGKLAKEILSDLLDPDHVAVTRIMITETPRFPHLGQLFRTGLSESIRHRVLRVLSDTVDQDALRIPDPDAVAVVFARSLIGFLFLDGLLVAEPTPRAVPKREIETLVEQFFGSMTIP